MVTAAHCINESIAAPKVRIGDHDFSRHGETRLKEKSIAVKKVFRAGKADLALLELVEEVDLDIYTPVCLPRRGESFLDKRVLALGNSVLFHFPGE